LTLFQEHFLHIKKKWSVVYAPLGCVGLPHDNTTILELRGTSQCENPFDKGSVQF